MANSNSDAGAADPRRFKLIAPDDLTPEQRAMTDAIRSGPRAAVKTSSAAQPGPLGGPFNVWLRSPGIGSIIQQLGAEIRFRTSLPRRLNEMAILLSARQWGSAYEWNAHHRLALEAGLDPAVADAIAQGRRPDSMGVEEQAVYDFARELHETHAVSDATYAAVVEKFGERGVVDLIAVSGFYVLTAMGLNVDRTPLPPGAKPPFGPQP